MIIEFIFILIGFALLIKGANFFVDGASDIAKKLKIPAVIIGLTIVAIGTSSPELAVSLNAAFSGSAELTIGNILGSNILNILIILGITAFIRPIKVKDKTIRNEMVFLFIISFLMYVLALDGSIDLTDGIFLLIILITFVYYLYHFAYKRSYYKKDEKPDSIKKAILYTLLGLLMIVVGSELVVKNAILIANVLNISERIIGLTLVSFGTSLPELTTAIVSIYKGKDELALGAIIGSNIFNILLILGLTSLVTTVPSMSTFMFDYIFNILIIILLMVASLTDRKISKKEGFIFLSIYAIYVVTIFY